MSGMMLAFSGGSYSAAPVNTVAPVVSGTATFGQTLTTTNGTWTGAPAPSFTYQWQRVTTNISGATSSTYVLVAADVGNTIRCVVTATNIIAAVSANSNSTASVVAAVPGAPTIGTATSTGSTTATVAFTQPASNGGATITQYDAVSSPAGGTGTLVQAGSGTISVTGLTQNTSYTFTVKATNSAGQSAASAASNSITTDAVNNFIASLYDTTDGQFAATGTYSVACSSTATYAVGFFKTFSGGVGERLIISSYSLTGTLNWKKYCNSHESATDAIGSAPSCACDSSGNLYVVWFFVDQATMRVMKINSSGVIQWNNRLFGAGYAAFSKPYYLAIDSSDGIYVSGQMSNDRGLIKLDTSGAAVWGRKLSMSSQGTSNNDARMAMTTGGGYVYVSRSGDTPAGSQGHLLYQVSTAGTLTQSVYMVGPYLYGVAVNSSTQLVIAGPIVASNNGRIAQFDPTTLASSPTWQAGLAASNYIHGVATDSSNNAYVAVSNLQSQRRFAFAKYNSSGTLQFQRRWSESTSPNTANSYAIAITPSGKVAVCGSNSNQSLSPTTQVTFNTVVATDGTTTGTYSNAGATYLYEAATLTTEVSNISYVSGTGSSSTFTPGVYSQTDTLADATFLTSTVTTV